jgi:hypothetical protein
MSGFIPVQCQTQDMDLGASHSASTPLEALADMVVHRLFGIGLVLQSAETRADRSVSDRLTLAVDELDAVVRDVRLAALRDRDRLSELRRITGSVRS